MTKQREDFDEAGLKVLLQQICNSKEIENEITKFVKSTHSLLWGAHKGETLACFDNYREIIIVGTAEEAEFNLKSPITLSIEKYHYNFLQGSFSNFYQTLDVISDIVGNYCSLDYPHDLWWSISSDMDSKILEILSGKYTYFIKKWEIYEMGHYPCGYLSEDVLVVW